MSKHQLSMYKRRTAWTLISDAYYNAKFQHVGAYFGSYADGLLFALKALQTRPLGKRRHIPKNKEINR